ncbi:Metalloprotease LoiP [bacterium HR17]|uniref:Metalloprotease LoiP n=1 Tax=Candidatus Fervidibacter japonicus TaxID=2035412 RepID=A0A2H5X8M1_9BACT|nr:Metalloprotease LoiP [bacterium HR17]
MRRWIGIIALIGVSLTLTGCDLDREVEKVLGAISQTFLEMSYDTTDDPLLTELTESVGRRIAEVSPRRDMPLRFRIFNTGEANALALPNGRIYVFRGMLEMADTEDELAAVLAHEAGHVAGRHSLKQFRLSLGISLLADLLNLNKRSEAIQTVAGLMSALYQLGYSRQQESDADTYGIRLALLAGYDPNGSVTLFQKFAQEEGQRARWMVYLSTHPPSAKRLQRAKEAVAHLGTVQPDLPAFAAHTRIADGYARRGLYQHAMRHYEAALKEQPNYPPALLGLAQAKEAWGERDAARQLYERVLERDPDNAAAKEGLRRLQTPSESPSLSSPAAVKTVPPSHLITEVRDEWERLRAELEQRTGEHLKAAVGVMELGRTLWEQLSALPSLGKPVGARLTVTLGNHRRGNGSAFDRDSPFDRWQSEMRWQALERRWDDAYDACVQALIALHAVVADWEGAQEDARRVVTFWLQLLADEPTLAAQLSNAERARQFADEAFAAATALGRWVTTSEQNEDALQAIVRQVQRAVSALTGAANLLQQRRSGFDWAAEMRLIDARAFARSALADTRLLLERVADKRAEVDRALLGTYRIRLAALEEKTPAPVVHQLLAYHLRVPLETVAAVRRNAPDAGAAALVIAVAKAQRKDAVAIATTMDFRGEWLQKLLPSRAPSGVKVALRWLTTAWEREWDSQPPSETAPPNPK